ncbi:MAG TPA: hypothetical protein VHD32_11160 [Candidatus Didemnitutus sp.]|nr:hypothetical protein [Candidatus Didemnitutus sp.]
MKAFFLNRSRREQILLTGFVIMAGIIWLLAALGHVRTNRLTWQLAKSDADNQQIVLSREADIEKRASLAIKSLDPTKTYDATHLASEISAIARDAGLTINTEPPHTTQTQELAIHSVQVTSRRAALSALLKFYQSLNERAPYLGLEQCSLLVERNSGGLLTATLQVSSVEVLKAAAKSAK